MSNTTPQTPPESQTPTQAAPAPAPAAPVAAPAAIIPPVPEGQWPGAWGAYKYSRDAVKFNLMPYLLLLIIPYAISLVFSFLGLPRAVDNFISSIVNIVFTVATTIVLLAAVRRAKVDVQTSLKKSLTVLSFEAYILQLLLGLIIVGSVLCFIIPFFFIAPRISLAMYYLVDQRLGVIGSLKASWYGTKGHVGKIYGTIGASIAMFLLVFTIIGIPFAVYFLFMYSAVIPVLYMHILKNPKPEAAAPVAAPAVQQ